MYPFAAAHSRTAFKSCFGADDFAAARAGAVARSAFLAADTYGSSSARNSPACDSLKSIAYETPSTPNATLSPAPSSIGSCDRSSINCTRYFCATNSAYEEDQYVCEPGINISRAFARDSRPWSPNWDWNYTDGIFFRDTPRAAFQ